MGVVLSITGDFESNQRHVIAAMLYPGNEAYRAAYCLRNEWSVRLQQQEQQPLSAAAVRALLDLPSRQELRIAAEVGTRQGTVAGDLLGLIYEQWRMSRPEPSMRAALRDYREWSIGKKYGDGEVMKYSDTELRRYFTNAAPAAHLWAAFRLLRGLRSTKTSFTPDGLPYLLGVAKDIQEFATTFVPKRTKPPKPVIDSTLILEIPDHIKAITPKLRLL